MKLSKNTLKKHKEAVNILIKDVLEHDEKLFVLEHWNPSVVNEVQYSGSFFTPYDIATNMAMETNGENVIDLCAGIGSLSFAHYNYHKHNYPEGLRVVCVEQNPQYVAIGKKILPEAEWLNLSVFYLDELMLYVHKGKFDVAIGNPPYGNIKTDNVYPKILKYTGNEFEYKVIEVAKLLANRGVFIIPQGSSPFAYSGQQCYRETNPTKYTKFKDQTGIEFGFNCGIDLSFHLDQWVGTKTQVEIITVEY